METLPEPRSGSVFVPQAAKAEGMKGFQLRLWPPTPPWTLPSESGIAVPQKPHSAVSRPTYQWEWPQPGQ